jgi:hypothetical protein
LKRNFRLTLPLGIALLSALASPARPQNIAIVNPGFEADSITAGAFVVLQPQGWNRYDPANIINQNNNAVGVIAPAGSTYYSGGAPEGNNAALVFLSGPQNAEAGLQQTLSAALQANTTYTLSVDVGNIASGTSLPGSSGGSGIFFDLDGFPGYRIDLLAGGTVIGSDNNSLGAIIPEGQFRRSSFSVSIPASHPQLGQNLLIRLVNLKTPGTPDAPNIEVNFDNVTLTASNVNAPEPSTLTLIGALMVGYMGTCRKRRQYSAVY